MAVHFTPWLQVGQLTILAVVIALKAPDGVHRLDDKGGPNRHRWSVFETPVPGGHRVLTERRLWLQLGFANCRPWPWFEKFVRLQRHRQPQSRRTSVPDRIQIAED